MKTAEEFRKMIEREVLKVIKVLAEKNEVKPERLRTMAQTTLSLINPGMSLEELYRNTIKLDDDFPELSPVVLKVMKEYEQRYKQKAIDVVSGLVKQGQYEKAQDVVKKVLEYKIFN